MAAVFQIESSQPQTMKVLVVHVSRYSMEENSGSSFTYLQVSQKTDRNNNLGVDVIKAGGDYKLYEQLKNRFTDADFPMYMNLTYQLAMGGQNKGKTEILAAVPLPVVEKPKA